MNGHYQTGTIGPFGANNESASLIRSPSSVGTKGY
jgi:hypothetical protein